MLLALALALSTSMPVGYAARPLPVAQSDDPPIQLWLNSTFTAGEQAQVFVQTAQDGYVLVLRVDAAGQVRVLFPLAPSDDQFVPGGKKIELQDGADREAFTADAAGTGTVLAAWSATPFTFDALVTGDHWNLSALGVQDSSADHEASLVTIVSGAADAAFDYDVGTYTVQSTTAYNDDAPDTTVEAPAAPVYGGSSVAVVLGTPWPYWYGGVGAFCDAYWSAWGCGPYYYPPYYVGYRYRPYGYYGYGYHNYGYGYRPWGFGRYGHTYAYGGNGYGGNGSGRYGYTPYRNRNAGYVGVAAGFRTQSGRGTYAFRNSGSWGGSRSYSGVRVASGGRRVVIPNRTYVGANRGSMAGRVGSRVSGTSSRGYRDGGYARPSSSGRSSAAPRGERSGGSAPSARSAPSGGSRRGGSPEAAPRSSGRSSGSGSPRASGGDGGGRRGGGGRRWRLER